MSRSLDHPVKLPPHAKDTQGCGTDSLQQGLKIFFLGFIAGKRYLAKCIDQEVVAAILALPSLASPGRLAYVEIQMGCHL